MESMLNKEITIMEFIYKITVRARVAFYLIISEKVFERIAIDQDEYPFIRNVLDECWKWLEGQEIAAEELWTYLESEDKLTINDIAWKLKDNKDKAPILKTITMALMYVVWKAFERDGEGMPESIEEVDESAIEYLIEYAKGCINFEDIWIDKLEKYMLENYTINENEYGEPIKKSIVMEVIRAE